MTDRAEALEALTGEGGPFEIVVDRVLGVPTQVHAHRFRSLPEVLAHAGGHGSRAYLTCDGRRLRYREAHDRALALAGRLSSTHGVRAGDRVVLLGDSTLDWIVAFWAAAHLGAITVPLNHRWGGDDVAYALEHCGPALVLADRERIEAHGLSDAVTLDGLADRPADGEPPAPHRPHEDDPACIVYTSGTSGRPKGVVHSHRNMMAAVEFHRLNDALAAALGRPPGARTYLLTNPLFHIAGLHNVIVARAAQGDHIVLMPGRFDARRAARLIESEGVTNWGAVPTMAHRLLELPDLEEHDLSSLRSMTLGADAAPPRLVERLRRALPVLETSLITTYGLTECSTAASVATPTQLADDPTTVGSPIATMSVEIRDPSGRRADEGAVGEVCLHGPQVMVGYWSDEAATREALDDQRWLRTGDYGYLQGDRLHLVSRGSDMIVRGGENIYPAEIEQTIEELDAVEEAGVVGAPDEEYGQLPVAVVVAEPGAVTAEGVERHLRQRLSAYKVPARIELRQRPLPRNATGKLQRRRLV